MTKQIKQIKLSKVKTGKLNIVGSVILSILSILSILLILSTLSCSTASSASSKQSEQQDTLKDYEKLTEDIWCQKVEGYENIRMYHIKSDIAIGYIGSGLAQMIYQIEGVQSVQPYPYVFYVMISPMYKWEDVQPKIINTINTVKVEYDKYKNENPSNGSSDEKEPWPGEKRGA